MSKKTFATAVAKLAMVSKDAVAAYETARAAVAKELVSVKDAKTLKTHKTEFIVTWLAAHDGAEDGARFAADGAKGFEAGWKDPRINRACFHWDKCLRAAESDGWARPAPVGAGRKASKSSAKGEASGKSSAKPAQAPELADTPELSADQRSMLVTLAARMASSPTGELARVIVMLARANDKDVTRVLKVLSPA